MVLYAEDGLYVFVLAGPQQARTWRSNHGLRSWRGALPDVMFPEDRNLPVSYLWDDEWRCVGGPSDLVKALVAGRVLRGRAVELGEAQPHLGSHLADHLD